MPPLSPAQWLAWSRTPEGTKWVRYSLTSVVGIIVSQVSIAILVGGFQWTARSGNIAATAIATVPTYWLIRNWTWGKSGRSHLWREVVPFWVLAFIGLAFSTWAADFVGTATIHDSRLVHTVGVMAGNLGAYGVLWVGKFMVFNRILFVHRHRPAADALFDA